MDKNSYHGNVQGAIQHRHSSILAVSAVLLANKSTSNDSLFKRLSLWKEERHLNKELLSTQDLNLVKWWPLQQEQLVQSILISASLLAMFLTTLKNSFPGVYCLGSLVLSAFLLHHLHDSTASLRDSKTNIFVACVGFCSLIESMGRLTPTQPWLYGILTLQLVTYAITATSKILTCTAQDCFSSIEEKAAPILKEHSALEVASQEMLNELGNLGQGCALLFVAGKGKHNADENYAARADRNKIEVLAHNPQLDHVGKDFALGELRCKLESVKRGVDKNIEETASLEEQRFLPLYQQLETLVNQMEQSGVKFWCAEFHTSIKSQDTAKTRQKISFKITQLGQANYFFLQADLLQFMKNQTIQRSRKEESKMMPDLRELPPPKLKTNISKMGFLNRKNSNQSREQVDDHQRNEEDKGQLVSQGKSPADLDGNESYSASQNVMANDQNVELSNTGSTVQINQTIKQNIEEAKSNPKGSSSQLREAQTHLNTISVVDIGAVAEHCILRVDSLEEQSPIFKSINTKMGVNKNIQSKELERVLLGQDKEESKENIFVYQIIHDIRHPLEAQKAIIEDTLTKINKKTSYFLPWFDETLRFRVRRSMQQRLIKLQQMFADDGPVDPKNPISESKHSNLLNPLNILAGPKGCSDMNDSQWSQRQSIPVGQNSSSIVPINMHKLSLPDSLISSFPIQQADEMPNPEYKSREIVQQDGIVNQHSHQKLEQNQNNSDQANDDQIDNGQLLQIPLKNKSKFKSQNFEEIKEDRMAKLDQSVLLEQENYKSELKPKSEKKEIKSVSDSLSGNISENLQKSEDIQDVVSNYTFKQIKNKANDFKRKFGEQTLNEFCIGSQVQIDTSPNLAFFKSYKQHNIATEVMFAMSLRRKADQLQLNAKPSQRSLSQQSIKQNRRCVSNLVANRNNIVSDAGDRQIQTQNNNLQVVGGKDQLLPVNKDQIPSVTDQHSLQAKFLCDQDMNRLIPYMIYERHVLIKMVENNYKFFHNFQKEFENIQAQSEMTKMLLNDLLDYAMLKNGAFNIKYEYFDLNTVVQQSLMTNKKSSQAKQITLEGPIFANPEDAIFFSMLHGDSRRYCQILVNFINNAVKFTRPGGKVSVIAELNDLSSIKRPLVQNNNRILIREHSSERSLSDRESSIPDKEMSQNIPDKEMPKHMSLSQDDRDSKQSEAMQIESEDSELKDLVTIQIGFNLIVSDTGVGIKEENVSKLFKSFGKLKETQKDNRAGVGLGLTICSDIVTALGGTIDVKTEENKGTDFIISLKSKCKIPLKEYSKAFRRKVNFESIPVYNQDQPQRPQIQAEKIIVVDVRRNSADNSDTSSSSIINEDNMVSFSQVSNQKYNDHKNEFCTPKIIRRQVESRINQIFKRRCLIANDMTFLLGLYETQLKNQFDEVVCVTDGQQAIDAVLAHPVQYFGMIILDINMPRKSGVQACQEITEYFEGGGMRDPRSLDSLVSNLKKPKIFNLNNAQQKSHSMDRFDVLRKLSGIQKNGTVVQNLCPKIFALTSDIDVKKTDYYKKIGFFNVYQDLNPTTLSKMLRESSLPVRIVIQSCSQDGDSSYRNLLSKDGDSL